MKGMLDLAIVIDPEGGEVVVGGGGGSNGGDPEVV